jgi:hypothetical protein
MFRMARFLVLALLAAAIVAGCRKEGAQGGPATGSAQAGAANADGVVAAPALEDVMERDPRYLIGISYPPEARAYPGLAKRLKAYADAARAEVMQAVSGLGGQRPTAPYDLSLGFSMLMETPDVVAVAGDGSSYTGGAHGNPLVARFVWLPRRGEALTANALIPDPAGWTPAADVVRHQLGAGPPPRAHAAGPEPADRAEMLRNGARMIDDGTAPMASNFDLFEPIPGADGKLGGLRFVFPPYQVGPYSDGVQSVDVPASVLLPVLSPTYRALFGGG